MRDVNAPSSPGWSTFCCRASYLSLVANTTKLASISHRDSIWSDESVTTSITPPISWFTINYRVDPTSCIIRRDCYALAVHLVFGVDFRMLWNFSLGLCEGCWFLGFRWVLWVSFVIEIGLLREFLGVFVWIIQYWNVGDGHPFFRDHKISIEKFEKNILRSKNTWIYWKWISCVCFGQLVFEKKKTK